MAVLSAKARALLSTGRVALRPTAADRERIQNALRARLGTVGPQPRAVRLGWQLTSGIIVGVGLVGGALFFAFQHRSGLENAAPQQAAPSTAQTAAPVIETPSAASTPVASVEPVAVVVEPAASQSHPPRDSLAQEVALLSRATSDLHRGSAAEALNVLNEHWRRFPNGLLSEERRGARAQALCLLGRSAEAQAELARLTPQSPAAARAKQVCAAAH